MLCHKFITGTKEKQLFLGRLVEKQGTTGEEMLSQKHAIKFPSEKLALALGLPGSRTLRVHYGASALLPVYPVGKPKVYPSGLGLRDGFLNNFFSPC